MNAKVEPGPVEAAVALARAEFEAAALRRKLHVERWGSVAAVAAATLLGMLLCFG